MNTEEMLLKAIQEKGAEGLHFDNVWATLQQAGFRRVDTWNQIAEWMTLGQVTMRGSRVYYQEPAPGDPIRRSVPIYAQPLEERGHLGHADLLRRDEVIGEFRGRALVWWTVRFIDTGEVQNQRIWEPLSWGETLPAPAA